MKGVEWGMKMEERRGVGKESKDNGDWNDKKERNGMQIAERRKTGWDRKGRRLVGI